jgi:hypothetical protein
MVLPLNALAEPEVDRCTAACIYNIVIQKTNGVKLCRNADIVETR